MPGKRKGTMDIREILRRIRCGQSDRTIAKETGIDRKTVARYHAWADKQGLLEGELSSLPELQRLVEELNQATSPLSSRTANWYSSCVNRGSRLRRFTNG